MLSYITWKYHMKTIKAGCRWGVYAFKVELDKHGLALTRVWSNLIPKICTGVGFCLNMVLGSLFAFSAWIMKDNFEMVGLICALIACNLCFSGAQLWYLVRLDDNICLESAFLRLHNQLHKKYRIPMRWKRSDGYELVIKLWCLIFLYVRVMIQPVCVLLMVVIDSQLSRWTIHVAGIVLEFCTGTTLNAVNIGWVVTFGSVIFCWGIVISMFAIFKFLIYALLYTNATRLWLQKLSDHMKRNKGNSRDYEYEYLCHQVLNKFANDVVADIVEYSIYIGQVILVCTIYACIKFARNVMMLHVLLLVIVITAFALKEAFALAVMCRSNSETCLKVGMACQGNDYRKRKRFWKSRRPVDIKVGKHFVLDSNDYILTIFGSVVIENVINLLVAF